ncbi:S66 family peptidase [Nocardioides solisilvae]|uniref:S66 family peptidase n=1 Tax=Nocardioides solisilvae TaxID=1542435 RepID=UPI000D74FAC6|nr:S66 peptidase family protein [Nocardioides solisilvae]
MIRFPAPLRPGDRIGVTAPSFGVPTALRPRLDLAVAWLRDRGHEVEVGECLGGDSGHVSAPVEQRAAELNRMLLDPTIRAVVPPWGGETAIDLVDRLDWDALATAEPTWVVGFSDISTLLLPLTTRLGWATLHGSNLMDTPYEPSPGLAHWTALAGATGPVTQRASGLFRTSGFDDWERDPTPTAYTLDGTGTWEVVGGGGLDVTGRLVGGCIETVVNLAGTPYGDVAAFGREHAEDGLVVYVEASDDPALEICRNLHGLRLAGWFEHANAILVGRTSAPPSDHFTQRDAVLDALGGLDVPIVLDVECGHVPPYLPLVNGALAHVTVAGGTREIVQELA